MIQILSNCLHLKKILLMQLQLNFTFEKKTATPSALQFNRIRGGLPLQKTFTIYINKLLTNTNITNPSNSFDDQTFGLNTFSTTVAAFSRYPLALLNFVDFYPLSSSNITPSQANTKFLYFCKSVPLAIPTIYCPLYRFICQLTLIIFWSYCESNEPFFCNHKKLFFTFCCNEEIIKKVSLDRCKRDFFSGRIISRSFGLLFFSQK